MLCSSSARLPFTEKTMNRNMLLGLSLAGAIAAGVAAQSSAQDPKTAADAREITVQGCLERDHLYNPSTMGDGAAGTLSTTSSADIAPTPFKLTHIHVIKDDASAASMPHTPDEAVLHVAAATPGQVSVNLGDNVNHSVELVGTTTSKDMAAKIPPAVLKVTTVRSLADKCQ
jgi:hypothetical protein